MYLDHFGLTEAPFTITPHTEFFFEGANRGTILETLLFAITHDQGIIKVVGEVGSGKTLLCRMLIERLPTHVETIYFSNPSLSRDEVLRVIAKDLKMKIQTERSNILLRDLQEHLVELYGQGRQVVILIDEAHAMPLDILEQVRLLSNLESNRHKLLQIVLFGQPELDEVLQLPKMRQLKERITHGFKLNPLIRPEVQTYLKFRLRAAGYRGPDIFTPAAVKLITQASEGWTRRINILADKALLAAYSESTHLITLKHVKAAILDAEFKEVKWWDNQLGIVSGAFAIGLLMGFGLHYLQPWLKPPSLSAPPQPQETLWAPPPLPTVQASNGEKIQKNANLKKPPSSGTSVSNAAKTQVSIKEPSGKLSKERLEATKVWLKTVPSEHYFLQLMLARPGVNPQLETLLQEMSSTVNLNDIYIYPSNLKGQAMLGVIYGSFSNEKEALEAIKNLPPSLKAFNPYPRSYSRIRNTFSQ